MKVFHLWSPHISPHLPTSPHNSKVFHLWSLSIVLDDVASAIDADQTEATPPIETWAPTHWLGSVEADQLF